MLLKLYLKLYEIQRTLYNTYQSYLTNYYSSPSDSKYTPHNISKNTYKVTLLQGAYKLLDLHSDTGNSRR